MTDVTADNFASLRPIIEDLIQNCSFTSIDTEFTGLTVNRELENSLFDSAEQRYQKIRSLVSNFTILQCGLAVFMNDRSRPSQANSYTVHCFNFNMIPRSNGSLEECFLVQPSSIEFLAEHSFNFQTVFSKGIPFLNYEQEAVLAEELRRRKESSRSQTTVLPSSISAEDRHVLDNLLSTCKNWLEAEPKKTKWQLTYEGGLPAYMVGQYLMAELPAVTCSLSKNNTINVQRTPDDVLAHLRSESSSQPPSIDKELETAVGFGHIFRCLLESKKPLVGHNMLLDLAFLYQKFYRPLPESYLTFKTNVHQLFPVVIDTKRLCFSLRNVLLECGGHLLFKTHLEGLYTALANKKSTYLKLYAPVVSHAKEQLKYKNKTTYFHEAGYDAYCCGFVFLRIAHMAVSQGVKTTQPLPFSEYIMKLSSHFNFVHIIKGPIYALNLAGEDPPSPRPPWLVVQQRFNSQLSKKDALSLIQCFKGIDFKEVSRGRSWSLWIAAPTQEIADEMCSFGIHPHLKVRRYSWWLDTPTGWSITRFAGLCVVLTVGLTGYMIHTAR